MHTPILDGIRKMAFLHGREEAMEKVAGSLMVLSPGARRRGEKDYGADVGYHYLVHGKYGDPTALIPEDIIQKTVPTSRYGVTRYVPPSISDAFAEAYDRIHMERLRGSEITDPISKTTQPITPEQRRKAIAEHRRVVSWMKKHRKDGFSVGI